MLAFFATVLSFFGAAFLVTPVGLAPFAGAALGSSAAAGLGLVVLLTAGAVSTTGKTRGLELPVDDRVPSRGMLS